MVVRCPGSDALLSCPSVRGRDDAKSVGLARPCPNIPQASREAGDRRFRRRPKSVATVGTGMRILIRIRRRSQNKVYDIYIERERDIERERLYHSMCYYIVVRVIILYHNIL